MSDCPVGCGRPVRSGHLMCGACWSEVPKQLQNDVYRTWGAYRKFAGITQSPERRESRIAYQEARDAALAAVR